MFAAFIGIILLQSLAISVGIGASTVALTSYIIALHDGIVTRDELRLLRAMSHTLRGAAALLLITSLCNLLFFSIAYGIEAITAFVIAQYLLIFVLYINEILMAIRIVPSTIGPAVQTATWYSLGILISLQLLDINDFAITLFVLSYLLLVSLFLIITNSLTYYVQHRSKSSTTPVTPSQSEKNSLL